METTTLDVADTFTLPATAVRYPPLLVPCSIDVDGTVLSGNCDLDLAWKWAAHQFGDEWASMSRTERSDQVGHALHELRRSAFLAGSVTGTDDEPSTS